MSETPRMTSIGSPPIWTAPAPYVGWRPFWRADASRFFGRGAEIRAVRAALLRSRIVVVHGPSAAGKTSLLRAGVIPALSADPVPDVLPVADLRLARGAGIAAAGTERRSLLRPPPVGPPRAARASGRHNARVPAVPALVFPVMRAVRTI